MADVLRNLILDRVDLCAEPANPECRVTLFKSAREISSKTLDPGGQRMATKTDPTPEAQLEELRKQLDELTKARADDAAALAKAKEDADTEIAKAAEAAKPIADQLELMKAEAAATKADLAKAKEDLAKAESERKEQHWLAVAKSDFEALGAPAEIGPMLKSIAESVPAETQATLERVLKAASAQLSSSAHMRQITAGVTGDSDVLVKITKAAQTLVDSGQAKTIEQAKARVVKENPDLAAEYAAAMNA